MNILPQSVRESIATAIAPLEGLWMAQLDTVRFPLADPIIPQMNAIESVKGVAHGFLGTEDDKWRVFRPTLR